MTRPQGVFVVLACLLAAAWAARRAGPALSADPAQARPAAAAIASIPTDGILEQAARLRARLASPPPFKPPSRNPFRFSEPPATRPFPVPKTRPALTTALVERPERPEMKLVGIAEEAGRDGVTRRTAIISAMAQLIFVKEGERVLGRYEVVRITADAAQLKGPDGETFTIALR